jgi:sugar/nucleoside kinase (ribokinase family)
MGRIGVDLYPLQVGVGLQDVTTSGKWLGGSPANVAVAAARYRWPKAPDLEIYNAELDLGAIQQAGVFWVTGTGLCQEPSRSATLAALAARGKRGITVLDLDYRPKFWPSRGPLEGSHA